MGAGAVKAARMKSSKAKTRTYKPATKASGTNIARSSKTKKR